MKKATVIELKCMLFDNANMYGSLNHVEMTNSELHRALFNMPDCELHYNIVGNCIFIFKPETKW